MVERLEVSKEELKGRSCDKFKKERRFKVFNRVGASDPSKQDFCSALLELHRNTAGVALRDKICPGSNTDNEKLDTVLGFLESVAYIAEVPLDYLSGLRPSQIFDRGNSTSS